MGTCASTLAHDKLDLIQVPFSCERSLSPPSICGYCGPKNAQQRLGLFSDVRGLGLGLESSLKVGLNADDRFTLQANAKRIMVTQ